MFLIRLSLCNSCVPSCTCISNIESLICCFHYRSLRGKISGETHAFAWHINPTNMVNAVISGKREKDWDTNINVSKVLSCPLPPVRYPLQLRDTGYSEPCSFA
jgi:hypothetical protein